MLVDLYIKPILFTLLTILLCVYTYYKINRSFVVIQQSGYNNKRFIKYFKTGYKDAFPLNEVLLFLCSFIIIFNVFIGCIITLVIAYYNQKFTYKVVTRYVSKKKLNITSRVKRLICTYVLITLLIMVPYIYFIFLINLYLLISVIPLYILLIYVIIYIANTINKPIEKQVKNHYIKLAKNKLKQRSDLFVIGITGSYGKTSIKNIIGETLNVVEPTLITPESFNTPMGLTITVNNNLDVFHKNFIAEMGAYYKGEIKELCDLVYPKVGIVSSIGPQHLETFKTLKTIQSTKMELPESLPSDGLAILNYDNEYIREYKMKNKVAVKYYSLENKDCDIYASDIKIVDSKTTFNVVLNEKKYKVVTNLLGRHNVENILASLLVCEYKNIKIDDALKAIKKLKPVKHRLEYKYVDENLSIIDDAFNSNPSGIKEAIDVLNTFDKCKKILITPGLIDLGTKSEEIHNELAKYLDDKIDDIYIIGNTNKKYFSNSFSRNDINYEDNFIDAYNKAVNDKVKKVILIANDLPDKFR